MSWSLLSDTIDMDSRQARRFAAQIAYDLLDAMSEDYLDYQIRMWQRDNQEYLTKREKERILDGLENIKAQLSRKTTKLNYERSKETDDGLLSSD